jgi:PAS domain S-box-containing protein
LVILLGGGYDDSLAMPTLETTLYLLSLILQVTAVIFAVRMARRSVLRGPWFAMAAALSVMAAYRLVGVISTGQPPIVQLDEGSFKLFSSIISPIISLLLFLSLFAIRRLTIVHESAEAARRSAEASRRETDLRLRAVFSQTRNFMGILSPDGTVLDVNPAPFAASGFALEQVVGRRFWETAFFAPSEAVQAQLKAGVEEAARGVVVRQESTYFRQDGAARTVDRSITPIKDDDGRIVYVIIETRDITERKRGEEELLRAKREAESASAAKDQFLAVLSHELRTPLTPVLLMVSMLEKQEDLSPTVRDEIAMIRRNVEMEARLIDDLLDLTRITRGKLQLNVETADVHVLIRAAVDICCGAGGGCPNTTLRFEAARHYVRGDPARLQQVFWNLLNNAKKFTPADGGIEVVTSDARDGFIRVEVIDTGKGIEPELLPKVFHAFEQGEATTRKFGGLGLGLAICKALVELHDGSIDAQSDGPGRGACFAVELPVLALMSQPAAGNGEGADGRDHGPLRILLVEDHEDTARMMRKLLSRMGHDVRAAGTAREAESAWRSEPFDLLISDLGLPDATGHELLVRLQEHRPVRGIAVSGYGMAEDVQRSSDVGFAAHVTKPLDLKRLKAAIATACDSRNQSD